LDRLTGKLKFIVKDVCTPPTHVNVEYRSSMATPEYHGIALGL